MRYVLLLVLGKGEKMLRQIGNLPRLYLQMKKEKKKKRSLSPDDERPRGGAEEERRRSGGLQVRFARHSVRRGLGDAAKGGGLGSHERVVLLLLPAAADLPVRAVLPGPPVPGPPGPMDFFG